MPREATPTYRHNGVALQATEAGFAAKLPNENTPNSRTAKLQLAQKNMQPTDFLAIASFFSNPYRLFLFWAEL